MSIDLIKSIETRINRLEKAHAIEIFLLGVILSEKIVQYLPELIALL